MASTAHGCIRATMGVDIVVQLEAEHVTPFVAGLGEEFYAEETAIRDAIARQRSVNLIHYATIFKVDLFVAGLRPFDHVQFARRQAILLEPPDQFAYVATAEDTIWPSWIGIDAAGRYQKCTGRMFKAFWLYVESGWIAVIYESGRRRFSSQSCSIKLSFSTNSVPSHLTREANPIFCGTLTLHPLNSR